MCGAMRRGGARRTGRAALGAGLLAAAACASAPRPAAFCPEGTVAHGFGPPLDLERRCELPSDDAEPLLHGPYQSWHETDGAEYVPREQGAYERGETIGCWSRWHPNGALESTGCYAAGKPHGRWVFFHESGRMRSEGHYRMGRESGPFRYWHADGALQAEGEFRDGRKRGTWSWFDEQGRLAELRLFDERGRVFERIEFRDGREVAEDALLQNMLCSGDTVLVASEPDPERGLAAWCRRFDAQRRAVPHGPYRELYPGGAIERRGVYDQGRKHDVWHSYTPDGVIYEEGPYERGLATGEWTTFHPDGSVETRAEYARGAAEGAYRRFYPGGALQVEGRSADGRREGIWAFFREDRGLDHIVSFREGEITDVTEFEGGALSHCPATTSRTFERLASGEVALGCTSRGAAGTVRHGRYSIFRADGMRASVERYREDLAQRSGLRVGCSYYWDRAGRLERLVRHTDDGLEFELAPGDVAGCEEPAPAATSAAPEP